VSSDCSAAYVSMFGAVTRYSPISSLIYMSKKAVQLSLIAPVLDSDIYVAEVVERERQSTGTRFDPSLLEMMEEDDIGESHSSEDVVEEEEEEEEIVVPIKPIKKKQKVKQQPVRKSYSSLEQDSEDDLEEVLSRPNRKVVKKVKEEKPPSIANNLPSSTLFQIPTEEEDELIPNKEVGKDTFTPSVTDL